MADKISSEQNFQDQILLELKNVAENDIELVSLIASRVALRMLPLLAKDGNFNFWPEDKRVDYLLLIWAATVAGYFRNHIAIVIRETMRPVAKASEGNDDIVHIVASAYYAISSSYYATTPALEDSINAACTAIFHAASLSAVDKRSIYAQVLMDCANGNQLDQVGLWQQNNIPKSIERSIQTLWPAAVEKLKSKYAESSNQQKITDELLASIPGIYQQILAGKFNPRKYRGYFDRLFAFVADEALADAPLKPESKTKRDVGEKPPNQPELKIEENTSEEGTLDNGQINQAVITIHTARKSYLAENKSNKDFLNRSQLVKSLAGFIADKSSSEQTIGLLGNWGAGKSSVVEFIKTELINNHQDTPFLFAEYNAWQYEHTDNIQAGIAQEIITALSNRPLYQADLKSNKTKFTFKQNAIRGFWWFLRGRLILRYAESLHTWRLWRLVALIITAIVSISNLAWIEQVINSKLGAYAWLFGLGGGGF